MKQQTFLVTIVTFNCNAPLGMPTIAPVHNAMVMADNYVSACYIALKAWHFELPAPTGDMTVAEVLRTITPQPLIDGVNCSVDVTPIEDVEVL